MALLREVSCACLVGAFELVVVDCRVICLFSHSTSPLTLGSIQLILEEYEVQESVLKLFNDMLLNPSFEESVMLTVLGRFSGASTILNYQHKQ